MAGVGVRALWITVAIRVEQLLTDKAGQPLPQLWELIMDEVKRHGMRQDDQTLLLLRVARRSRLVRRTPTDAGWLARFGAWQSLTGC